MDLQNQLEEKIKQLRLFSDQPGRLSVGSARELARILIEMAARVSLLEDKVTQLEGLLQERDHLLRDDLSDLFLEMAREVNSFQSLWRVDSKSHQSEEGGKMRLSQKAKRSLDKVLLMFKEDNLPEKIAQTVIFGEGKPSDNWSLLNRAIMLAHGTTDARGYRQVRREASR